MQTQLIKFPQETLDLAAVAALLTEGLPALRIYHAVDHPETYVWVQTPVDAVALLAALKAKHPHALLVSLSLTTDVAGHSAGQAAPWFYMVETDIQPDAREDFDQWYETEHLPGLASVPGTVRARRYLAPNGSPHYYACYDLAQREAFGSPAWVAVRATSWSDRVRPNFINTKRTMFRLAHDTTKA